VFSLLCVTELACQVESVILEHGLFPTASRLLAAVSGGLDSMALLHLLAGLAPKHKWQIVVAHFNHQLRGRSSDADEAFVDGAAGKLGLSFLSERGCVREYAKNHGISIEMAARQLRHEFLARCAKAEGIVRIALAHHADDQVELFFLRLLRGAGPEGLKGMQLKSQSPFASEVTLIRPLLKIPKAVLQAFVREQRIRFREDATNVSIDFLRNRVRHELLPLLGSHYQPAITKTTLRLMNLLDAESTFVASAAEKWFESPKAFGKLAIAVQRRVIQRQLHQKGLPGSFDAIEWLRINAEKPLALHSKARVLRNKSGTLMTLDEASPGFNTTDELAVDLEQAPAGVGFGEIKIRWKMETGQRLKKSKPGALRENFDADRVGSFVILRHWRPGDRFQPIGMTGTIKLQDWFGNLKIPKHQRHSLVVATTRSGEIFWVEGQRIAEPFKLTSQTKRRLVWMWTRP
jgi:tRNA(Ile)-lysidine synthase